MDFVDAIFTKLTLRYGRDFLGRWEGLELDTVKADWRHELSGFVNAPHCVKYALENLPLKAPHVGEFKALANKAPPPSFTAIPAPEMSEEQRAHVKKMLDDCKANLTKRTKA